MKRLLAILALACSCNVSQAYESSSIPRDPAAAAAPTKYDGWLKQAWESDYGRTSLHLLDNATGASLYDFNRKEFLAGAMTSIYKPENVPLSLDFGAAGADANTMGFPYIAGRVHGRDILSKNESMKRFFDSRQNLLKYLACGVWGARDFNYGIWRYGGFFGAEVNWGKS